jgi:hypothetical protein
MIVTTVNTATVRRQRSIAGLSPLAMQVRTAGDVQLTLLVRADGSIESASADSGHPLLKQAALDSAQHSQFTCEQCGQEARNFRLLYSFQLDPSLNCAGTSATPKVEAPEKPYPPRHMCAIFGK